MKIVEQSGAQYAYTCVQCKVSFPWNPACDFFALLIQNEPIPNTATVLLTREEALARYKHAETLCRR